MPHVESVKYLRFMFTTDLKDDVDMQRQLRTFHARSNTILRQFAKRDESVKGECSVFKKKKLWMKTMHFPNTIRSYLVTIVPMAPFTPKSTSKLRSALHIRYSIVIPRFISSANTAQS